MAFASPDSCPVAQFSRRTDRPIDQVSTSVSNGESSASVAEFLVEGDADPPDDTAVEPVFSYGTATLYRTTHDSGDGCPCACLGTYGCPVHRYTAEDGNLTLVFHAQDFQQLQDVMADLRDRFPSVDVQQLLQPPLEGAPSERVFVNRGRLTNRQREVLQAAYERGYFERPKNANATEIAADLDIAPSTFTEHLVTAQRKLLGDILESGE